MNTITIKNRTYTIEATGLKNVAYTLTSGKLVVKGIRNQNNADLMMVMNKRNEVIGYFLESTMREVTVR